MIFNKKFELLLQQRSEIKVTFPLYWSNSCCSHPRVGLSTIEIAKEATDRARYELGSNLSLHKPRFLTRVLYKSKSDENWGEYEMDYVFFAQANDSSDVNINIEEVKDTTWVNRDEIRRFVNRKDLLITP